jgi:hypothetical protein
MNRKISIAAAVTATVLSVGGVSAAAFAPAASAQTTPGGPRPGLYGPEDRSAAYNALQYKPMNFDNDNERSRSTSPECGIATENLNTDLGTQTGLLKKLELLGIGYNEDSRTFTLMVPVSQDSFFSIAWQYVDLISTITTDQQIKTDSCTGTYIPSAPTPPSSGSGSGGGGSSSSSSSSSQ